uniref:Uncharacterized protein n=1 Tax=Cannabis sativa TaxID=3483 RepID=A0A803PS70_CANSA
MCITDWSWVRLRWEDGNVIDGISLRSAGIGSRDRFILVGVRTRAEIIVVVLPATGTVGSVPGTIALGATGTIGKIVSVAMGEVKNEVVGNKDIGEECTFTESAA